MKDNDTLRLYLIDIKGNIICKSLEFSNSTKKYLSHPYRRYAEFRKFFDKFLPK